MKTVFLHYRSKKKQWGDGNNSEVGSSSYQLCGFGQVTVFLSSLFLMYNKRFVTSDFQSFPKSGLIGMNYWMVHFDILNLQHKQGLQTDLLASIFEISDLSKEVN